MKDFIEQKKKEFENNFSIDSLDETTRLGRNEVWKFFEQSLTEAYNKAEKDIFARAEKEPVTFFLVNILRYLKPEQITDLVKSLDERNEMTTNCRKKNYGNK